MRQIVNPSDGRWRVRIDGADVAEVILADTHVGPFRAHVAAVSGARVSVALVTPAACHVCGKTAGTPHDRATRAAHHGHYAAHGGAGMCPAPAAR